MWFLSLVSYVAMALLICLALLTVVSVMYILGETIREFTSTVDFIIDIVIKLIFGLYVGILLFEEFPIEMILCGMATQHVHLFLMQTFPEYKVSSPAFILTVACFIINHYLAFTYFSRHSHPNIEVIGYFTLCLWIIPFFIIVSLLPDPFEMLIPTERMPPANIPDVN